MHGQFINSSYSTCYVYYISELFLLFWLKSRHITDFALSLLQEELCLFQEREIQDRKEHKETRETREHKSTKEYKDTKERKDSRESKEHKDTVMDNKDHTDSRENREHKESKDNKDTRDHRNDSKESTYKDKKAKGWSKDEVASDRFDKMNRKYPLPIPSHMSSSSQAHTSQLPAMKSDGQTSTFNIWSSYSNVSTDMANTTTAGTGTTSSPSASVEAHTPSQPTNRQLTPINEHRNNHAIPSYGSRHSISNPLNMTKTNLSFNMNNHKSVEEDAANHGSTPYR